MLHACCAYANGGYYIKSLLPTEPWRTSSTHTIFFIHIRILHIRASNFNLYAISTLKSTRRNVNLLERISNKKSICMHAYAVGEEKREQPWIYIAGGRKWLAPLSHTAKTSRPTPSHVWYSAMCKNISRITECAICPWRCARESW